MTKLILASTSPRRARLLEEAGIDFEVLKTDALEVVIPNDPVQTVSQNSIAKLSAAKVLRPTSTILSADTIVYFQGQILGKPSSLLEARDMLLSYSGKTQTVYTAISFTSHSLIKTLIAATLVHFRPLTPSLVANYIDLVHPLDRAGAYDISSHGDLIISRITGSFSNVVGLPLELLPKEFFKTFSKN